MVNVNNLIECLQNEISVAKATYPATMYAFFESVYSGFIKYLKNVSNGEICIDREWLKSDVKESFGAVYSILDSSKMDSGFLGTIYLMVDKSITRFLTIIEEVGGNG